jgi:hypothetical protein
MSQFVDNPGMAIRATATINQYTLVKADGTNCAADANDDMVGVAMEPRTTGQLIPVRFRSAGTIICVASAAITAGALVYKAANGKIGLTNTNARVGIALEAASADGDHIAVKP